MSRRRHLIDVVRNTIASGRELDRRLDRIQEQVGALEAGRVARLPASAIDDAEFRVFSQFGEDGILQFLVSHVPIETETFVEIGVESYRESNTRFLLVHNGWRGLAIDGGEEHVEFLRNSGLTWRHSMDAISAWVDRDNVNQLISSAGIRGDIGVLSLDIDGNDYWVLERVDVVSTRILVVEYNSVFGAEAAVTIPYDRAFRRDTAHFSHLYWGASLGALTRLATSRGYALVAGNRAGNNAFFVRRDCLGELPELTPVDAYRTARFREARHPDGALAYVTEQADRLALIADCEVWDLDLGDTVTVRERFNL